MPNKERSLTNDAKQTPRQTRRAALQLAGAGVIGLATLPTLGAAKKPTSDEIIKRGLHIREKTQSNERYEEYLRNHGFGVAKASHTYTVTKVDSSNDGVSTQTLDRNDLDITLYLFVDSSDYSRYIADLSWDWSRQDADDWGEPPDDVVGFYWEDADWNISSAAEYYTNRVFFHGFNSESTQWRFNDEFGDDGSLYYCATALRPHESMPSSDREVGANYIHTYATTDLQEVSGGFPKGVSATLANNDKKWKTAVDEDGDPLVVSQDEAIL